MNQNYLFLDDIRMPVDVGNYINPVELRSLFRLKDWVIVRSYNEFVKHISENGLPECVSFDHDLADGHYAPENDNYKYIEKTGYDCAKWMIDFIQERNLQLPKVICHSVNPVGKDNILALINSFKNSQ